MIDKFTYGIDINYSSIAEELPMVLLKNVLDPVQQTLEDIWLASLGLDQMPQLRKEWLAINPCPAMVIERFGGLILAIPDLILNLQELPGTELSKRDIENFSRFTKQVLLLEEKPRWIRINQ